VQLANRCETNVGELAHGTRRRQNWTQFTVHEAEREIYATDALDHFD
jgi:hypothetical protein